MRRGHVPGLDGLRGLAVLAVLLFHAFPQLLPGGFLGVDVFFVLSGYLITAGLLRRLDAGRGLDLREFWTRRVRRLVPALVVALVGSTALAWVAVGEFPAALRLQWLGALTYTSNWIMVAQGTGYFAEANPPLFQHLWSLAIEEQFYLLWPLLLLGVVTLLARTVPAVARSAVRVGVIATLALASAAAMVVGAATGALTDRLYFGTDTHAFGLLAGAALAAWLSTPALQERRPVVRGSALAWVAAGALVAAFFVVDGTRPSTYLGVLAGVSVLVTYLVATVVTDPGSRLARAFSGPALGWLGRRSYAAYLWHWPLLVLMRTVLPHDAPAQVVTVAAAAMVALTLLVAEASYRWVEAPALADGLRPTLRRWWGWLGLQRRAGRWAQFAAAVTGLALVVALALGAVVRSPARTQLEEEIAAGQAALAESSAEDDAHGNGHGDGPSDSAHEDPAGPNATPGPDAALAPPSVPSGKTLAPSAAELTATVPPSPVGPQVLVIGDSVTLAAAPQLLEELPGVRVDASVGHQLWDARAEVRRDAQAGNLREVLVLALGTNGTTAPEDFERILADLGPDRHLVLVTPHGNKPWIADVQMRMREFAAAHPGQVLVADWDAVSVNVSDWASDGIHPRGNGQAMFARLVRLGAEHALHGQADAR